jgi:photosystem II stability/assembly factor-like uncharacterized protein
MATITVGWAVDTDGNVVHTVDSGQHWTNVRPHNFKTYSLEPTAFIGAEDAWVVGAPENTGALAGLSVVLHTVDSGRTWDQRGDVYQMEPGQLQMLDADHGWFTTTGQCTSQCTDQGMSISATVDGGEHWRAIMNTDPLQPTPPSAIPPRCGKHGPTFNNLMTGWVTARCIGGKPFFFTTGDGGRTWTTQSLPPPPGFSATAFADCFCDIGAPTFVAPSTGALTLSVTGPDGIGHSFLYTTANGGGSWVPHSLPQIDPAVLNVVSSADAYVLQAGDFYKTRDGGRSWTQVSNNPVLVGATLDFLTVETGFVLGSSLARTLDGGQTWTVVTPLLAG